MGGLNSSDVGQATHVCILENASIISEDELMQYGKPLPSGDLLAGVYQDDLGIMFKTPLHMVIATQGPDRDFIDKTGAFLNSANFLSFPFLSFLYRTKGSSLCRMVFYLFTDYRRCSSSHTAL